MNTPAHLLLGVAVFGRRGDRPVTAAALAGALTPDLSLYVLAGVSLAVLGLPPEVVFGQLYFSAAWQQVFAIDNSLLLWGALVGLALWRRHAVLTAFAGAALLHILCDLPLHHDDGRPHFWPLTDWVYASPISYWDSRQGAGWVAPLEVALALVAAGSILWRHRSLGMMALVAPLVLLEVWVARQWLLFF
jgi:hypothetical protein